MTPRRLSPSAIHRPNWFGRRLRACGLAAALAPSLFGGSVVAADREGPAPLYTAKPRFRIPFQFDAAEMKRLGAVSIELHVSTDQGQDWTHEQTVEPSAGKFSFEAASNGEYWFAVRTLDRNNKRYPDGPLHAGLKVIVDSIAPTVDVNVEPLGRDRVSLSWDATDDNLDLGGLSIEWRDAASSQWQPVSILPAASGQTSWSARGQVEVRATVRDLAGNTAEAGDSTAETAGLEAPAMPSLPASAPFRPQRNTEPDFSKPVAEFPAEGLAKPFPEFQTAERTEDPTFEQLPVVRSREAGSYFRQQPRPASRLTSGSPESLPPIAQQRWSEPPQTAAAPATPAPETTFAEVNPSRRAVRTRNFKIGYQVDDVGPSGVAAVNLYITENGGKKWYHYGGDADLQSPFDVVVPADGEYGFAIRVQSGKGVSTDPPQPGDVPEMQIVVDQAPPVAQVMPLRQGQGSAHNQVLIEWSVSDSQLAEQPVSLSYADNARGPWIPITDWTANTGRYIWTIKEPVRQQVFVKLEARDAAGNISEALADQPIVVDLSRPTARIVDVESDVRPTPQ
jgi:hypothetical protein